MSSTVNTFSNTSTPDMANPATSSPYDVVVSDTAGYKHRQVIVDTPFCGPVLVDAGLVSTLEMIWAEGYETDNSCENNDGQVWISFDQQSFERLVQRAHDSYEDALASAEQRGEAPAYFENLGEFLKTSCKTAPHWSDDGYVNASDEWVCGDTIHFYMSVRFECILLDTFTTLFRRSHTHHL